MSESQRRASEQLVWVVGAWLNVCAAVFMIGFFHSPPWAVVCGFFAPVLWRAWRFWRAA